jgi:hypothetical protein
VECDAHFFMGEARYGLCMLSSPRWDRRRFEISCKTKICKRRDAKQASERVSALVCEVRKWQGYASHDADSRVLACAEARRGRGAVTRELIVGRAGTGPRFKIGGVGGKPMQTLRGECAQEHAVFGQDAVGRAPASRRC